MQFTKILFKFFFLYKEKYNILFIGGKTFELWIYYFLIKLSLIIYIYI